MKFKDTPSLFCLKSNLGSLEYEVMKSIWDLEKRVTVRDIVNLQQLNSHAYTTIMTVINHLYDKGFLTRKKIKKTYYYSPIIEKNYVIGTSLSNVFRDLNKDYGKRKILYLALSNSILPRVSFEIPPYTLPIIYGISITLLSFILILSTYNLLQNSNFLAVKDYLSLLTSDLNLFAGRLQLFFLAIIENLPIADALGTLISFALVLFLFKKLSKILDIKIFVLS